MLEHKLLILFLPFRSLRNDVNFLIERVRKLKIVGSSQETQIYLFTTDSSVKDCLLQLRGDDDFYSTFCSTNQVDDLRFVFLVSRITVVDTADEIVENCPDFSICDASESSLHVGIKLATGKKCERCWYYSETIGKNKQNICGHSYNDVCPRCSEVLMRGSKSV